MARYFFHILNGQVTLDEAGLDLPDMSSVRAESIRTAGQMLSDGEPSWKGQAWQMLVVDEAGTIVFGVNCSIDRHGL